MGSSEKFCLRWNDFETNISSAFREIREDEEFFDVTLACDEQQVKAHKVILSACSPFFRTVLKKNPHQHPLLYMKGVRYQDLEAVLNFMYHGEVNVSQDDLNSFLAVAEDLRVKGLTQNKDNDVKPKSEPSVPKLSHRKTPDRPDSGPPTKRPRNSIAPSSQASQSSSNQSAPVEEDDIQDITPATVKSEPNQPMIVQPDVHYDEGQMGDESFGAEDDNFDYGQYESESGDMSYGADGQMVGVAGPSSADGSKDDDLLHLAREIDNYVLMRCAPMAAGGFKCLVCNCTKRDGFDIRRHMAYHMLTDLDQNTVARIDSFVRSNVLQNSPNNHACLICRKVMKMGFGDMRKHFIIRHLKTTALTT